MKKETSMDCLSEYRLDRLHTSEASSDEQRVWGAHLEKCERCQTRLTFRKNEVEMLQGMSFYASLLKQGLEVEMLGARTFDSMEKIDVPQREKASKETNTREASTSPSLWSWMRGWAWGGMVLAVGAMALLHFSRKDRSLLGGVIPPHPSLLSKEPAKTPKGQAPVYRLLYFTQGSKHSSWAHHGQPLSPGDLIQFSVKSPRAFHVMIVGVNVRGEVSVVIPYPGSRSRAVSKGASRLPTRSSLELDDYLGLEAYLFFSSEKPFSFNQVKGIVKEAFSRARGDLLRLDLQESPLPVQVFLIRKRSRLGRKPTELPPPLQKSPHGRRAP